MTRLFAGTPFDKPPTCGTCGQLEGTCTCPPAVTVPTWAEPRTQTVKLFEEKRKGNRFVTIVRGLSPETTDFAALLTTLKNTCGAGGSIEEHDLVIQGQQLVRLTDTLRQSGYRIAGGKAKGGPTSGTGR
ncbi:MAG: translation initiation factor [Planctomyces sp.]|nr:translation initiation factor [Planctomyces sp.]